LTAASESLLGSWQFPSRRTVQREVSRAADERGFTHDEVIQFEQRRFYFQAGEDAARLQRIICEGGAAVAASYVLAAVLTEMYLCNFCSCQ
jgi:hypothetical protein